MLVWQSLQWTATSRGVYSWGVCRRIGNGSCQRTAVSSDRCSPAFPGMRCLLIPIVRSHQIAKAGRYRKGNWDPLKMTIGIHWLTRCCYFSARRNFVVMGYAQFPEIVLFGNFFPRTGNFFRTQENRVLLTALMQADNVNDEQWKMLQPY